MPAPTFAEIVHHQFSKLAQTFPGKERLKEFLEEAPIPETTGPLLLSARVVAEMLRAAPSEEFAYQELRADEDGTRAFYQFSMTQFQTLREKGQIIPAKTEGGPFEELASWALGLIAQRLKERM